MLFRFDLGFIPGTLVKLLNTMLKKWLAGPLGYGRGSVRRSKHASVVPGRAREQAGKGDSGVRESCPPPPFTRGKK
jgi:hypothetical protein